jgi:hypothetical protein
MDMMTYQTELHDPRGPVNDDFKRGFCFAAKDLLSEIPKAPDAIRIVIKQGVFFECRIIDGKGP